MVVTFKLAVVIMYIRQRVEIRLNIFLVLGSGYIGKKLLKHYRIQRLKQFQYF